MEEKQIIEGNKLIAEFMGWRKSKNCYPFTKKERSGWGLQYHISWDWLMPVVEKIDSLRNDWPDATEQLLYLPIRTPIAEVYEHITSFIQWYNTNHLNKQDK